MGTQTPHKTRVAILRHARIPMLVAFLLATVLVLRVPVLQLRGGHVRAAAPRLEARPPARQAASELPTAAEMHGRVPSVTSPDPDQLVRFDDHPAVSQTVGTATKREPADTELSSVTPAEDGPDQDVADAKSRRDLSAQEQLALQDVDRMMEGVIRMLRQVHQHIEAQP